MLGLRFNFFCAFVFSYHEPCDLNNLSFQPYKLSREIMIIIIIIVVDEHFLLLF